MASAPAPAFTRTVLVFVAVSVLTSKLTTSSDERTLKLFAPDEELPPTEIEVEASTVVAPANPELLKTDPPPTVS